MAYSAITQLACRTNLNKSTKNIILWRHAEAELADVASSLDEDILRNLTPKGKQQAKLGARWLQKQLPKNLTLISSPALRALQTAEALKYYIHVDARFKPTADISDILNALNNIDDASRNLLIVGHQPWLGGLAAHLLGCAGAGVNIKKGAIWWLRQSTYNEIRPKTKLETASHLTAGSFNILTVQTPSLLR